MKINVRVIAFFPTHYGVNWRFQLQLTLDSSMQTEWDFIRPQYEFVSERVDAWVGSYER